LLIHFEVQSPPPRAEVPQDRAAGSEKALIQAEKKRPMCGIIGHYFTIEGDGGYLQDAGPRGMDLRSLPRFSFLICRIERCESQFNGLGFWALHVKLT